MKLFIKQQKIITEKSLAKFLIYLSKMQAVKGIRGMAGVLKLKWKIIVCFRPLLKSALKRLRFKANHFSMGSSLLILQ